MKYYQPFVDAFEGADGKYYYSTNYKNCSNNSYLVDCIGINLIDFLNADLEKYKKYIIDTKKMFKSAKASNDIFILKQILDTLRRVIIENNYAPFWLYNIFIENVIEDTTIQYVDNPSDKRIDYKIVDATSSGMLMKWFSMMSDVVSLQKKYRELIDDVLNVNTIKESNTLIALEKVVNKYKSILFMELPYSNKIRIIARNGKYDNYKQRELLRESSSPNTALKKAVSQGMKVLLLPSVKLHTFEDVLYYEFTEMLKKGYRVNRCKLCGNYYIMKSARNTEYCTDPYDDGMTCAKIAAQLKFKGALDDKFLGEYFKYYKTVYQRYYRVFDNGKSKLSGKDMSLDDFMDWSEEAQSLRKEYTKLRDEISQDISITPQQRWNKKKSLANSFIKRLHAIPTPYYEKK